MKRLAGYTTASVLLAFLSIRADTPPPAVDHGPVLEQFDVSRRGGMLLTPVLFQDRQYLFALDTGASFTVYDVDRKSVV